MVAYRNGALVTVDLNDATVTGQARVPLTQNESIASGMVEISPDGGNTLLWHATCRCWPIEACDVHRGRRPQVGNTSDKIELGRPLSMLAMDPTGSALYALEKDSGRVATLNPLGLWSRPS